MKKIVSIILALIMLFAVAGCSGNSANTSKPNSNAGGNGAAPPSDEVFELNLSLSFGEPSAVSLLPILKNIEDKSDGQIKFNIYYSQSLVAAADIIKALQTGIADVAAVTLHEYPSNFKRASITSSIPFIGMPSTMAASEIYMEMLEEHPSMMAEYTDQGLTFWSMFAMPPISLFQTGTDKPIIKPDDLKGHKIITSSPELQQFIAERGGAPMAAPPPDFYSNLEKGVADSIFCHINVLNAFGCAELTKRATFFGESGSHMFTTAFLFSTATWERMPAHLQQLFIDEQENVMRSQVEFNTEQRVREWDAMVNAGIDMYVLSDDEMAVWMEAFAPYRETVIKSLLNDGVEDAEELYNALVEKIEKYS